MIVGKGFVWLHFPKCAGHAVEQALRSVVRDRHAVTFDPQTEGGWHDSLADRLRREPDFRPDGRTVISGFRRLPYWLLSRVHYEASRPPYLCATRAMMCRGEFFDHDGTVGRADEHALHWSPGVERWIRTEHLAEDFERHFGDVLGSHLTRAAVRKVRRIVNGTRLNYIRSLDFYFTAEELEGLYAANPVWAGLERALYGDVLRVAGARRWRSYVLDQEMRFVTASALALSAWHKPAGEVIGRPLLEVFPLARGSEVYEAQVRALQTRQAARIATVSPTLAAPVQLEILPHAGGLQVSFALDAA